MNYYVEKEFEEFCAKWDNIDPEFRAELLQLLKIAKIAGAEQAKYRILDRVRNHSIGVVVEAFDGDLRKLIKLSGEKLAKELENE